MEKEVTDHVHIVTPDFVTRKRVDEGRPEHLEVKEVNAEYGAAHLSPEQVDIQCVEYISEIRHEK